jgi:YVTN family beta-propeller protein
MRSPEYRILRAAAIAGWVALATACSSTPPQQSAETSGGPRVFVTNEIEGTVSVVDPVAGRVTATIPVGKRPRGIRATADGQTLFVALSGSPMGGPGVDEAALPAPERQHDGIGVIDVRAGRLARILPGGSDPEQFVLSRDGKHLFIANEDAGQTTVLDVESGAIVKTIKVGGEPEGVDLSSDGRFVYVTAEADNEVFVIETSRLEVVKTIPVGARPRSTAFVGATGRAYVSAENDASIAVIDTSTHTVIDKVAFGSASMRPMGLVAAPDGRQVYVTTGRGGTLARIDTATNEVAGSLPVGERPWGVAISRDGRTLVTANGPSNDITIVDAVGWKVIRRVPVGERPWGVVYVE